MDNRLRFGFELLSAIRRTVGPDFIVGVRYTGDEDLPGGLSAQDGLEISRRQDSGRDHGALCDCERQALFDDAGDHAALQAAEVIGASGARLEVMTPDRSFAPEVMAMTLVPSMRLLQKWDVTFTVTYRLLWVERVADGLLAHVGSDYGGVHQTP